MPIAESSAPIVVGMSETPKVVAVTAETVRLTPSTQIEPFLAI